MPNGKLILCRGVDLKKTCYTLQRDLKAELLGPSARHRVKLEPHAVPDSNWTDPRDTDAGDALVTDHLREQAAKSSKRIAVLKRKQLVRGDLIFNWKL